MIYHKWVKEFVDRRKQCESNLFFISTRRKNTSLSLIECKLMIKRSPILTWLHKNCWILCKTSEATDTSGAFWPAEFLRGQPLPPFCLPLRWSSFIILLFFPPVLVRAGLQKRAKNKRLYEPTVTKHEKLLCVLAGCYTQSYTPSCWGCL